MLRHRKSRCTTIVAPSCRACSSGDLRAGDLPERTHTCTDHSITPPPSSPPIWSPTASPTSDSGASPSRPPAQLPVAPASVSTDSLHSFTYLTHLLTTSTLLHTLHTSPNPLYFLIPASSAPIPLPLLFREYKSLRLSYDGSTSTLRISMPTPLHEAILKFASELLTNLPKRPNAEVILGTTSSFRLPTALYVHEDSDAHVAGYKPPAPPAIHTTPSSGKRNADNLVRGRSSSPPSSSNHKLNKKKRKAAATIKTPDYAFQPRHSRFPTIVIEVGWTESSLALASDAEQWLVKCAGHVNVVFTILLIELNCPLPTRRAEYHLREESPDSLVDDDDNGSLSPCPSTASDHIQEIANINVADWVGEVVVIVNVWRYNAETGQAYRDGVEYKLYPDGRSEPDGVEPPWVSVRDVWGERDLGVDAGEMAFRFDWGMLRGYVEDGRREYAFGRRKDLQQKLGVVRG
ncbi:hypothetical protein EV426DRAFT_704472 [Tirmania nivea]|nr:hypothetical protein EV426DRAFT_704472 [Tirmania nivea]